MLSINLRNRVSNRTTKATLSSMPTSVSFPTYVAAGVAATLSETCYHLRTLWLTFNGYIKCIGIPMTIFGVLSAFSGSNLTAVGSPHPLTILARIPAIFSWLCVLLLHFGASNQRRTESILEDKINKPWRPIPSGRISQEGMRRLFFLLIPCEIMFSWGLGTLLPTVAHMIFNSMYDDLKLADTGYIMRNILIGFGYMCYATGTTAIATGLGSQGLNNDFYIWVFIVGAHITTTVQAQDLPDVMGDKVKGRRTIPLVLGDKFARWSIVIPAIFWTMFCPYWWGCGILSSGMMFSCGGYYCSTVLRSRSLKDDEFSWRMWSVWTTLLYSLPAAHALGL